MITNLDLMCQFERLERKKAQLQDQLGKVNKDMENIKIALGIDTPENAKKTIESMLKQNEVKNGTT